MSKPSEHKTVQARILAYAEAIGWTIVSREEAEERRAGFPTRRGEAQGGQECPPSVARAPLSLFFDDLLDAKVREFNPRYAEAEGALLGKFRHLHTDIYGNREFPVRKAMNRRDCKEDFAWSIGPKAAGKFPGWEFWRRLCQNWLLASEQLCICLLRNSYIV